MKKAILIALLFMAGCSAPEPKQEITQGANKVGNQADPWLSIENTDLFEQEAAILAESHGGKIGSDVSWVVLPCGHGTNMVQIIGLADMSSDSTMWTAVYLTPYDDDGDSLLDSYDIEGIQLGTTDSEIQGCSAKLSKYLEETSED